MDTPEADTSGGAASGAPIPPAPEVNSPEPAPPEPAPPEQYAADDDFAPGRRSNVRPVRHDPWAHRRGEPRTFAALWIVFLFSAAVVSLGAGGSLGLIATDVYRASARVLLVIAGVGVGVLWPMLRLSQETPGQPVRAAWQDTIVVTAPLHALAWPQALPWMAAWPLSVAGALAAHFTAWALLWGGVLALCLDALRSGAVRSRSLLVAAVLALVSVGPAGAHVLRNAGGNLTGARVGWMLSPVTGGWEITRDQSWSGVPARVDAVHWWTIGAVAVVAALVWLIAGFTRRGAQLARPAAAA
ncbi:MAG: hypothetical protein SFY69_02695 [Planctomycetota bacterium]|nr:hypothetical protein [Planctomycetota bacterium]